MSRLGIDRSTGFIYEGRGDPTYPAWPTPAVSQVTLIETSDDLQRIPASFDSSPFTWMFREDSFDPVSRIRRGRLFQTFSNCNAERTSVEAHPAIHSDLRSIGSGGRVIKELCIYVECTDLLNKANKGEGLRLAIGVSKAHSFWQIVQTECTVNQDVLVTLRAESAFGILPDIDTSKILHPKSLADVQSAIGRVLNAAYRELPTSVVDQCRNAATVLISRWMHQETNSSKPDEQDLGEWIKAVKNHFTQSPRTALFSALEIINRLHPRGKDNEKERLELRPVTEKDAEFAVHIIGFIIQEIGWGK